VPAVVRGEVERIETGVGQTRVRLEDGVRARFVQLDTGDVVCDDATVCLVPVHTDMRIESKGRPDQVLRAAALEKRMGRTWNLTLGGGSVTAE
jgi:class 3 adenylate cyclase